MDTKKSSRTVTLTLNDETWEKLLALCEKESRSLAGLIKHIVLSALQEQEVNNG